MKCPFCGIPESKVIDSRIAADGVSIRRRRECMACSRRFTTFEATEDRLLPILIGKNTGQGATAAGIGTMLSFVSSTLKHLSEEVFELAAKADRLHTARAGKAPDKKPRAGTKSAKKSTAKKRGKRKKGAATGTDEVVRIMGRLRRPAGISVLKAKTGFNDKKIRNTVYRLCRQGRLERAGRGVYVLPEKGRR